MLVKQSGGIAIAVCSIILAACGTNNVRSDHDNNTVPAADPLAGYSPAESRYVVQQQARASVRQHTVQEQQVRQAVARHSEWEQQKLRQQREAQQRFEAEKKRIAREKYHQNYRAEQMRLAEQKLAAEKQQAQRLYYRRKFEAEQQRKQAKVAQQSRLAQQRRTFAEQQQAKQQQIAQQQAKQQLAATPAANTFRGRGRLQRLPGTVRSNLRLRGVSEHGMSAYVRPASGRGPAVLTAAADTPRNPASTMKLVTTYAALGVLGPNYRWPTEIYTTGPVVRGTLQGDVIIKGYGDPDFKEADLTRMLQVLSSRGIHNISGNLVTDISYFNVPYRNPGAFDGKSKAAYNAQPEALLYQGRGSNYRFRNLAKRVQRSSSRMPTNAGARADLNTNLFGAFWKIWVGRMGKGMQGRLRNGVTPPQAKLVYRHQSKPLRQIMTAINKKSNNVMARQLMLSIGAKGTGTSGTPRNGAQVIGSFLESRGLRFPELRIENGSGLSRISRISARSLGEMLVNAYNSPWRNDYMNSLAVLGVDGTLRNRMKKSGIAGRGRFKTGTLRNVRGLAGYVQASNGQTYVVSILHNDNKARSKARNAHDELVKWVYYGARGNFASR